MKSFLSLILISLLSACIFIQEPEPIITKDYIINPNWVKSHNSLDIFRMKLKDSTIIINLKNPSEPELYYGLLKDSSFYYSADVLYDGENFAQRKVYFNKDNGFLWWKDYYSNSNRRVLGNLSTNTWYLLLGIQVPALYYIYIDSVSKVHTFKVSQMTNY